jgi:hypothetical protein
MTTVEGRGDPAVARIVFLDIEASSLDADSWPVEIGAAWIDDDEISVVSSLIRPDPDWPRSAWSSASASIHAIAEVELEMAPRAAEVAAHFAALLQGALVVSDAPAWDGYWLRRLLATLDPAPRIAVRDFEVVAHVAFSHQARPTVHEYLARSRSPHRAGPDARRLAAAWRAGLRAERRLSGGG